MLTSLKIQNAIWKVGLFSFSMSTVTWLSKQQFIYLQLLVAKISYHFPKYSERIHECFRMELVKE